MLLSNEKLAGERDATNPVIIGNADAPVKLVYVLAASHSGSTLLSLLLGSHPDTCTIGELKATSLGEPERYLCSCGARIRDCAFWREVAARMRKHGVEFDVADARTDFREGTNRLAKFLLKPLHRAPALERLRDAALFFTPGWRRRLQVTMRRNRLFARTVCELYGARMIVDSSKIGLRLKYLLRDPGLDVKIVRLIRDGRAVALTYMRPHDFADASDPKLRCGGNPRHAGEAGRPMRVAAREWRRCNEEAESVLATVEPSRFVAVRYEDLCLEPDNTLSRVFDFLGLDPGIRERDFRKRCRHVLGNGMRLDTTAEIRLDERWKTILTPEDLRTFDEIAGALNRKYGYR